MYKALTRLLPVTLAVASISLSASATTIPTGDAAVPVGYISYDVTGSNVAQFDIVNLTGANSSGPSDPTFPVTNPISFSGLSLTVDYAGGVSRTFGSSYFTLDADGFSFLGEQLSTLSGAPTGLAGAIDATLTGTFSTTNFTVDTGTHYKNVVPGFSAFINDPSGLQSGDLAVIYAAAPVPEPATWLLMGTGLLGLFGIAGARKIKRAAGYVLALSCAILLVPATAHASSAVKLSTATSPGSGTAGTGTVSLTGSGFPAGTITPATTHVSLAATCGGTATAATVTSVTTVIGTEDKIAFTIPGSLSAGNYFVSISGTSTSGSFSSTNCSTLQVLPGTSPVLTIDTTNPVDWVIKNGAMTIDYNSNSGAIWSIVPAGTQDQLIDFGPGNAVVNGTVYDPADGETALSGTPIPAGWNGPSGIPGLPATYANLEPKGFYESLAGFTTVAGTGTYTLTSSYLDFSVVFAQSTTNTTEYEEHFVVTPNDPGLHIYFALNHPAKQPNGTTTNGAGSIGGQVQWTWRGNANEFTNFYQKFADLSMVTGVKTPLPTPDDCFSGDNARNVQDVTGRDTIALYPQIGVENAFSAYPDPLSGIPPGFHRHYCVKYDFSSYEYIHDAHGLFGNKYGQWVVFTPGHDTFIDGPSKENLNVTGNILTIEPNSGHYRTGGVGGTSIAAGVALSRIYGPFYVRINQIGMATDSNIDGGIIRNADDMFNDALAAAASFKNFYNNESVLISKGYVPTVQRGSVAVQVNGVAGSPRTAWAVLSQPGVNHENSTTGYQYTLDVSATGSGTFANVVPGTYRLSVFDFGKWGEYRNDTVVVTAGNTTNVPTIAFQPENFGTVVGTIGIPDRSSHEFLHGAYTQDYADGPKGYDDRETYMAWNYWADWANSPSPGAPVYYMTNGPGYTATNNPLKWNYAHWGAFNPAIYAGACPGGSPTATNGYALTGCTSLGDNLAIPAYVNTLPGHSGTNGTTTPTPAWQIHFTTPTNPSSGFVVLSHALASSQAGQTVVLNSQTALTYNGGSSHFSDAVERSGLSGYTEWITYQWPISALNPAGTDNVITVKITGTNSENSDDAFRLEFSTTGANPTVTGWHDYSFVTKVGTASATTTANDTVPNP